MCFPMKCGSCGLTTWGGCGKHVPGVYKQLAKDQVCMCKAWPGVEFPKPEAGTATKEAEAAVPSDTASAAT